MQIDFDELRESGVKAFNGLVGSLNSRVTNEGHIKVPIKEIQNDIDNLRKCLAFLICLKSEEVGIRPLNLELSYLSNQEGPDGL